MEQSLSRPIQPHNALSRGDRNIHVPVEDVTFPDPPNCEKRNEQRTAKKD